MRVDVKLTGEDLKDLEDLAKYTLTKIALLVERHSEITATGNMNLWRAFFDEVLMMYVTGLLVAHMEALQTTVKGFEGGSGI